VIHPDGRDCKGDPGGAGKYSRADMLVETCGPVKIMQWFTNSPTVSRRI